MMTSPLRYQTDTKAFADFWNFEDGKEMLKKLDAVPPISDAHKNVSFLFQKDELADNVITDIFHDKPFPEALQSVINFSLNKSQLNDAPESVQILLDEMHSIPTWLNTDLLKLGREVCNRSGKSGLIVLRNYSLMIGYQSAAINKPLISTGALHSGAVKRIADTTNFWYAVTGENALDINNDGFIYCLRTRLIHAYSRVMIKQRLNWPIEEQGEPLNYWDMVATYLGFSLVFMRGLINLGFTITDRESEAVYHLWKYIGYLIGIPPQLLPDHHPEAIKSLYLWSKTQPEADEDSIALAQALHLEPLKAPWPEKLFEKKFIQQVNLAFNYHLIGKRSCEILHLPVSKFKFMVGVVIGINKMDEKLGAISSAYREWLIRKGRKEQLVIRNRVNFSPKK